MYSTLTTAELL